MLQVDHVVDWSRANPHNFSPTVELEPTQTQIYLKLFYIFRKKMQNIKGRLAAECKTANEMICYKARLETFRFVYLNSLIIVIIDEL